MLLRRGAEVKSFILQALSVLIASVLGPLIVEAVAHYKEMEWDGLQLGLITLGACTAVAVAFALVFRAFL